jgi:hypothetical protein
MRVLIQTAMMIVAGGITLMVACAFVYVVGGMIWLCVRKLWPCRPKARPVGGANGQTWSIMQGGRK